MRTRPSPGLRAAAACLAAMLLAACASIQPIATVRPSPDATTPSAGPTRTARPSGGVTESPPALPATPTPTLDPATQPFTVLLLGLDHEGRTDAIMVAGVDPVGRSIGLASIPRDTINVPTPSGQTITNEKINGYFNMARADAARYPQGPARATADMVETLLGIRIDYTAATTFGGFQAMTNAMGGVTITLPKAIVDPSYQVTTTDIGISFPKGRQTLDGKRALIYVRTRYSDNDFERQRRQQAFIVAAGGELLASPELFAGLLEARRHLSTDFPLARVPALIAAIGSLDGWTLNQKVLGPTKYASRGSCPCGYSLAPNLDAMRELAASYYPWAVRAPSR